MNVGRNQKVPGTLAGQGEPQPYLNDTEIQESAWPNSLTRREACLQLLCLKQLTTLSKFATPDSNRAYF